MQQCVAGDDGRGKDDGNDDGATNGDVGPATYNLSRGEMPPDVLPVFVCERERRAWIGLDLFVAWMMARVHFPGEPATWPSGAVDEIVARTHSTMATVVRRSFHSSNAVGRIAVYKTAGWGHVVRTPVSTRPPTDRIERQAEGREPCTVYVADPHGVRYLINIELATALYMDPANGREQVRRLEAHLDHLKRTPLADTLDALVCDLTTFDRAHFERLAKEKRSTEPWVPRPTEVEKRAADMVLRFVRERCSQAPSDRCLAADLYQAYTRWLVDTAAQWWLERPPFWRALSLYACHAVDVHTCQHIVLGVSIVPYAGWPHVMPTTSPRARSELDHARGPSAPPQPTGIHDQRAHHVDFVLPPGPTGGAPPSPSATVPAAVESAATLAPLWLPRLDSPALVQERIEQAVPMVQSHNPVDALPAKQPNMPLQHGFGHNARGNGVVDHGGRFPHPMRPRYGRDYYRHDHRAKAHYMHKNSFARNAYGQHMPPTMRSNPRFGNRAPFHRPSPPPSSPPPIPPVVPPHALDRQGDSRPRPLDQRAEAVPTSPKQSPALLSPSPSRSIYADMYRLRDDVKWERHDDDLPGGEHNEHAAQRDPRRCDEKPRNSDRNLADQRHDSRSPCATTSFEPAPSSSVSPMVPPSEQRQRPQHDTSTGQRDCSRPREERARSDSPSHPATDAPVRTPVDSSLSSPPAVPVAAAIPPERLKKRPHRGEDLPADETCERALDQTLETLGGRLTEAQAETRRRRDEEALLTSVFHYPGGDNDKDKDNEIDMFDRDNDVQPSATTKESSAHLDETRRRDAETDEGDTTVTDTSAIWGVRYSRDHASVIDLITEATNTAGTGRGRAISTSTVRAMRNNGWKFAKIRLGRETPVVHIDQMDALLRMVARGLQNANEAQSVRVYLRSRRYHALRRRLEASQRRTTNETWPETSQPGEALLSADTSTTRSTSIDTYKRRRLFKTSRVPHDAGTLDSNASVAARDAAKKAAEASDCGQRKKRRIIIIASSESDDEEAPATPNADTDATHRKESRDVPPKKRHRTLSNPSRAQPAPDVKDRRAARPDSAPSARDLVPVKKESVADASESAPTTATTGAGKENPWLGTRKAIRSGASVGRLSGSSKESGRLTKPDTLVSVKGNEDEIDAPITPLRDAHPLGADTMTSSAPSTSKEPVVVAQVEDKRPKKRPVDPEALAKAERAYNIKVVDGLAVRASNERPLSLWRQTQSDWFLVLAVTPASDPARPWRVLADDATRPDAMGIRYMKWQTIQERAIALLDTAQGAVAVTRHFEAPADTDVDMVNVTHTWLFGACRRWAGQGVPPSAKAVKDALRVGSTLGERMTRLAAHEDAPHVDECRRLAEACHARTKALARAATERDPSTSPHDALLS